MAPRLASTENGLPLVMGGIINYQTPTSVDLSDDALVVLSLAPTQRGWQAPSDLAVFPYPPPTHFAEGVNDPQSTGPLENKALDSTPTCVPTHKIQH